MKIITQVTLRTGSKDKPQWVYPGQSVDLSEDEAKNLIARGLARMNEALQNQDKELLDGIVDAIADLPKDAFGKDGKPSVRAIESVLEQDISAKDRDVAWEMYMALADA